MYPTVQELEELAAGATTVPAAAALYAAIAEWESLTGWRPYWSPTDQERTLRIPRAYGSVLELPEPCQSVVGALVGQDQVAVDRTYGDGLRILGIGLAVSPMGEDVEVRVKGGAWRECPADARLAILVRAAQLAGVDPATEGAAKLSAAGMSLERGESLFEAAAARHRRMVL